VTFNHCSRIRRIFFKINGLVFTFLPRDATQSAVMLWQIVRLFVCMSVTLRYRDHIGWRSSKIISRLVSLGWLFGLHRHHIMDLQLFSRYWALSVLGVTTFTFQGHVTSSVTWPFHSHKPFPNGGPLKPNLYLYLYLAVSEVFNGESRNGWHGLKRPLNKCQGHSFWYQSISHIRLFISCH